jgi:non-specific serine/threonine protein kinase
MAYTAVQLGELDRAGELMADSLAQYRRHSVHPLPPEWLHTAGMLALALGDPEGAQRHLEEALQTRAARGEAGRITLGAVVVLEGLAVAAAERGQHRRAIRLAAIATAQRQARRIRPEAALARQLDEALTVSRDQLGAEAVPALEEAATRLTATAAVRYALTDVWVEPATAENDSPLSTRERQIAELVAAGLTNRQVATRLHIALRTVEAHLETIRNKLGVRSRAQLAAWTARHLGDGRR